MDKTTLRHKTKTDRSIQLSDMQRVMDSAYQHHQTVNLKAWCLESKGAIETYNGYYVHHQYWVGGYVRIRKGREIRTIPEIFIIEINGLKVYL